MRTTRFPGIAFRDTASGWQATLAGTNAKVWLLIWAFKDQGLDYEALRENYAHLTDFQLRSALAYYEAYPEEIDEMIAHYEAFGEEEMEIFYQENPGSRPPHLVNPASSA
ncbi:MAG: DUF433 domain-containing protein [Dehalococcoidia bacterium]